MMVERDLDPHLATELRVAKADADVVLLLYDYWWRRFCRELVSPTTLTPCHSFRWF